MAEIIHLPEQRRLQRLGPAYFLLSHRQKRSFRTNCQTAGTAPIEAVWRGQTFAYTAKIWMSYQAFRLPVIFESKRGFYDNDRTLFGE